MNARMLALILGIALAVPASARADGPWGYFRIPDLSQDQKTRMDSLWMAWMREAMARRAALEAATVDLRLQLSTDNPDATVIQQTIERITSLERQGLEADIRLVMEVKKVLKPDQSRWFNLDLLSRARYSDKLVEPDSPVMGGPGPSGFPGGPGPGPGGPPSVGPAAGPQGPGGAGGWCAPGGPDEGGGPPSSPARGKGRK